MHRDSEHIPELVSAARAGDGRAREQLVEDYLPLVYNVVGRALDGHADVDDVVQDTMFRALDGLGGLREPSRFRSWLVAIAMNQIRRRWNDRQQAPVATLERVMERPDPSGDFVDLTILRLGLSGQRREVAEATRWLDEDDRALLSLWWQEASGRLTRAELAEALGVPARHAAVRVQRMKAQLETGRVVVRALAAKPRCGALARLTEDWDGRPAPVWRKRVARHARGCRACGGHWADLIPAEGLLAGLALVVPLSGFPPVPGVGGGAMAVTAATTGLPDGAAGAAGAAWDTGAGAADGTAAMAADGTPTAGWEGPGEAAADATAATAADGVSMAALSGTTRAGAGGSGAGGPAGGEYGVVGPAGEPAGAHGVDGSAEGAAGTGAQGGAVPVGDGAGTGAAQGLAGPVGGAARWRVPAAVGGFVVGGALLAALWPVTPDAPAPVPDGPPPRGHAAPVTPSAAPTTSRTPSPSPSPTAPPSPTASVTPQPTPTASRTAQPDMAQRLTALVNTRRAEAGCAPLRLDPRLTAAARAHARDMVARGYFAHADPEGRHADTRMADAGYRVGAWAENLHQGPQDPAVVVEDWMDGSIHQDNMLGCHYRDTGVAAVPGRAGTVWVQTLAGPA
ncbi:sigma-70 family RNA polymerase sigma factor [Streptomyces thermolilacinus]|uniref:sigma-70 family RNA polymerase sigma factor n=1 Tax=Streptomyces thermolilacinus TaxID=285540 RepID=UPI00340131B9